MREDGRLFKIIYYLLSKGKATAPELAEKFEVSVRTIYRDLDVISSAGIPIYTVQGKGGGISILEDFILEKSLLSKQEKEQILMALQGIIAIDEKNSDQVLTKLKALFQSKIDNWIEVDFSDWVKNKPKQDIFNSIKEAIFGKHIISFMYFGGGGKFIERRIEPIKLVFKSKDWYVYGFCLLRNDYRFFKLTRIKELNVKPEIYLLREPVERGTDKYIRNESTLSVKLKFDKKVAFRVYDEFTDEVTEDEEGNLYVRTDLPSSDALYSYLFSFADAAELLEPEEIRQSLKEKLSNMQKKYET